MSEWKKEGVVHNPGGDPLLYGYLDGQPIIRQKGVDDEVIQEGLCLEVKAENGPGVLGVQDGRWRLFYYKNR